MNLFIALQAEGGAGMINLVFMAVLFSLFYFFFIRPQAKKQKEQITFMNAIQKGDDVVTSSGIIGKVNKIEDQVVTLEVDTKTHIRVLQSSISKEMTEAYEKSAKAE